MLERKKIKELGEIVNGGTPSTKVKEYWDGDIPWITPYDLSKNKNKWIRNGERNISKMGLENSNAKLIPSNSIMISTRAPIGYVVKNEVEATTNQGIKSFIPNTDLVDADYMYYFFVKSTKLLNMRSGGTTFRELSTTSLKNLEVKIPDIKMQKEISERISVFDDKMLLNNQLIDFLEEYAQLLFHKWFVDFNFPDEEGKPYKDNGGEMYEVDGKMMPVGWSGIKLDEIVSLKNGLNYKANGEKEPNAKIISVKHLNNNFILNDYIADDFYLEEQSDDDFLIRKYDTIIARSASPGESAISLSDLDVYYSGFSIRMRPISEEYRYYVFFNSIRLKKMITSNADGTIIKNITQQSLNNFKSVISDKIVLEEFNKVIEPILLKIELLQQENRLLEDTRDLLIKKLIK